MNLGWVDHLSDKEHFLNFYTYNNLLKSALKRGSKGISIFVEQKSIEDIHLYVLRMEIVEQLIVLVNLVDYEKIYEVQEIVNLEVRLKIIENCEIWVIVGF